MTNHYDTIIIGADLTLPCGHPSPIGEGNALGEWSLV
jgi:hypothetical protein